MVIIIKYRLDLDITGLIIAPRMILELGPRFAEVGCLPVAVWQRQAL